MLQPIGSLLDISYSRVGFLWCCVSFQKYFSYMLSSWFPSLGPSVMPNGKQNKLLLLEIGLGLRVTFLTIHDGRWEG